MNAVVEKMNENIGMYRILFLLLSFTKPLGFTIVIFLVTLYYFLLYYGTGLCDYPFDLSCFNVIIRTTVVKHEVGLVFSFVVACD